MLFPFIKIRTSYLWARSRAHICRYSSEWGSLPWFITPRQKTKQTKKTTPRGPEHRAVSPLFTSSSRRLMLSLDLSDIWRGQNKAVSPAVSRDEKWWWRRWWWRRRWWRRRWWRGGAVVHPSLRSCDHLCFRSTVPPFSSTRPSLRSVWLISSAPA